MKDLAHYRKLNARMKTEPAFAETVATHLDDYRDPGGPALLLTAHGVRFDVPDAPAKCKTAKARQRDIRFAARRVEVDVPEGEAAGPRREQLAGPW